MNAPKLRFPEFREAGEWEIEKLENESVALFVKERTPLEKLTLESYISTENLLPDFAGVIRASKLPPTGSFTRFKKGDILISNIRPYLKKVWLSNKNGASSNDVIVIRAKSKVSNLFLSYLLQNDEFINYIMKGAKGVKMPRGDISLMKEYPIAFPNTEEEQQKIAACLSSLDELITAQAQKLEALKIHKKGLMQQLFPAEGETVPKLRFPEFREAGEWEETSLESLVDLQSGYAFQSEYFSDKGKKLLTPKNFSKNGYANFNEENTKFTTEDFDPKYVCKEGDLLLLLTDLTPSCELLGKPILLTKKDGEILLNQRIVRVISKGRIETQFLLYFFLSDPYHKRIKNTATGSTVRHSSNKIVASTKIYFPSEPEQQKIAACLSSLDELITTQAQKLEALKTHKKGLMQQLFPNSQTENTP